ncbi:hypothetical protein NKW51_15310, partial [Acetobacter lambici]|nr:hypothetical protein [Acetobacter lambici]
ELIAKPTQPGKTLFNIKETRLLHIAIPSINAEEIESYRRPQNQRVFRTLHIHPPVPGSLGTMRPVWSHSVGETEQAEQIAKQPRRLSAD